MIAWIKFAFNSALRTMWRAVWYQRLPVMLPQQPPSRRQHGGRETDFDDVAGNEFQDCVKKCERRRSAHDERKPQPAGQHNHGRSNRHGGGSREKSTVPLMLGKGAGDKRRRGKG